MNKTKLAWIWAAAILLAASAASIGVLDEGLASGLYLAFGTGAVVSLSQTRCRSC